jgi:transcriptional regulator with XRE-family HTH domain
MSKSKTTQEVNKKVRAIREFKGFSQEYVADKLGLTQSQYSRREIGSINFSSEEIGDLARILGISVAVLYSPDSLEEMIQKSLSIATGGIPSQYLQTEIAENKHLIRLVEMLEDKIKDKDERIKELEIALHIRTAG